MCLTVKGILTLGSLFDGIGVFPLAAELNGIKPLWASEIEAAPIAITKYRFPEMRHLGDITKLHGREVPAVDVITFGSPCQNLSQIGDRSGLEGKRSSLFYEAIGKPASTAVYSGCPGPAISATTRYGILTAVTDNPAMGCRNWTPLWTR